MRSLHPRFASLLWQASTATSLQLSMEYICKCVEQMGSRENKQSYCTFSVSAVVWEYNPLLYILEISRLQVQLLDVKYYSSITTTTTTSVQFSVALLWEIRLWTCQDSIQEPHHWSFRHEIRCGDPPHTACQLHINKHRAEVHPNYKWLIPAFLLLDRTWLVVPFSLCANTLLTIASFLP